MIKKIDLSEFDTFDSECVLEELEKINFFFGKNGTGKTRISNFLIDATKKDAVSFLKNDKSYEILVYNQQFILNNFNEDKLKGIFSLGEGNVSMEKEINKLVEDKKIIQKNITDAKVELETLNKNISNNDKYITKFWNDNENERKKLYEAIANKNSKKSFFEEYTIIPKISDENLTFKYEDLKKIMILYMQTIQTKKNFFLLLILNLMSLMALKNLICIFKKYLVLRKVFIPTM